MLGVGNQVITQLILSTGANEGIEFFLVFSFSYIGKALQSAFLITEL